MSRYLFYMCRNCIAGTRVEMFYKLQASSGIEYSGALLKLLGAEHPEAQAALKDMKVMHSMDLRARFALATGPFMVSTNAELTRDDIEQLLASKDGTGELDNFLRGAKI